MSLESLVGKSVYTFIKLDCKYVVKVDNSVKSLYKIASSLSSPVPIPSLYELSVTNVSTSKTHKKKLKVTKSNLLEDTEFSMISDTEECELLVLIRRNYFDEATNEYSSI